LNVTKQARRNLVLLRAGDTSIHQQWFGASGEERNWDFILNYFGDDPGKFRSDDGLRIDGKGPKLQGLHDCIRSHEELIRAYDYIWLPDEDLACTCAGINRMFEVCHERKLKLAQPSLTHDSYFTFPITLNCPQFRLRFTTFVEMMAPCFSRETLLRVLPTMTANYSGWGVDHLWTKMLESDPDAMAIIDEVQMRHTRPVGSGKYYDPLKARGTSAWDELLDLEKKFGITERRYWMSRAVRRSGREVRDGVWLLVLYAWSLLTPTPSQKRKLGSLPRFLLSALWQQVKGRPQRRTA
jgi:hypothetical protein